MVALAEGSTSPMAVLQLAARLVAARRSGRLLDDALGVADVATALEVQAAVTDLLGADIIGWKCALPTAERIVVAPIYADGMIAAPGPVRVAGDEVRFEPELAFIIGRHLDRSRHDRATIVAVIDRAHLALELVHGRFVDPDAATFEDMLADGLFNDGVVLGPEVPIDPAVDRITIDTETCPAAHPAGDPLAPLVWLANYLAARGHPLEAGMTIVTGAFAPARRVRVSGRRDVGFGRAGGFSTDFILAKDAA